MIRQLRTQWPELLEKHCPMGRLRILYFIIHIHIHDNIFNPILNKNFRINNLLYFYIFLFPFSFIILQIYNYSYLVL